MSLAKRTLKGIFWAYASFFGGRLLTLVTTAILARVLIPNDFGLIGFALVLLAFIEVMRGFGINEALIYTSENLDEMANTAFWLNVAISTLQTLLVFALAPLALNFFDDPRIVDVVRVLALNFILNGLGQTQDALLQKELEFKRRFLPDLLAQIVKGAVSVALALAGLGVWSLVTGHLVGTLARTVSKWYTVRWRPRLHFYPRRARELWGYGVHILLFEMLNVALEQADQMFIGALLGAVQLGYYTIAARIPEMVIANFSIVLTRVIFPTFAKLKDQREALTEAFLATTRYTAYITIPAGLGMSAIAPELILVAFGDQWGESVMILQVLALLGMVMTLPWSAGDVFKALGRPDISTRMLLIEALYTFPLVFLFVSSTRLAVMASLANLISLTITALFRFGVVSRHLKLKPWFFVTLFWQPFLAGGAMWGGVTLWRLVLADISPLLVLLSSIVLGVIIYGGLMLAIARPYLLPIYRMAQTFFAREEESDSRDGTDIETLPAPTT